MQILSALVATFAAWPGLRTHLFSTDFLPHSFCYLKNPALVWTHVAADSVIALSYLSISATIAYLVLKSRRGIPLHWLFWAFALFIVSCGGTHVMEVVTTWKPLYVFSALVKIVTALSSLLAAILFPVQVPYILASVHSARESERITARLRASEERKEALLQEVHHRVKNNLAVICSLFYLQTTHIRQRETVQVCQDMESRVRAMALVHESLYSSDNLTHISFDKFAHTLAEGIAAYRGNPEAPVQLTIDLEPVVMGVDIAVPCSLILNELITNAFKHGLPDGRGELKLTLRNTNGKCILAIEDSGKHTPGNSSLDPGKPLGLKLVRLLTEQIGGNFNFVKGTRGSVAYLNFEVEDHA